MAFFIMFTPIANLLARPLVVKETLGKVGLPQGADIIVVLGGGAFKNGVLAGASNERLIRGLLLYKEGWAPRIMFTGGAIESKAAKIAHMLTQSTDKSVIVASEGGLMGDVALRLVVPEKAAVIDPLSTNTYENLLHAKKYMDEKGLKSCIIVTSSLHMKRASLVAEKLGLLYYAAPIKDAARYRTGGLGRINLMDELLWEYAAIALYRFYGYI